MTIDPIDQPTFEDIPGIGEKRAEALREAGFETIDDLQRASDAELRAAEGIDSVLAHDIKATVRPSRATRTPQPTMNKITPEDWHVTEQQASHLAALTDRPAEELLERSATDIADELKWEIDPELLHFEQVCGRVVKRDPTTDELLPVPNATVHVEDTDCDFLGYFPSSSLWGWFHPFGCHREEIATVTTDACGRFCVFVPRWEIDRVRRLRRERVCLPEIVDPRIRDILDHLDLHQERPIRKPPRPQPDPVPDLLREPGAFDKLSGMIGEERTEQLFALTTETTFGDSTREVEELLRQPAPTGQIQPPTPEEVPRVLQNGDARIRNRAIALDRRIEDVSFQPTDFIGPFLRCRDVVVPEWTTILDVPDITFRVTQDVDSDGTEETVYSEGYFDVDWNDVPDDEVVLEADNIALTAPPCEAIPTLPECETPELRLLGAMPLASSYHSNGDPREGYALRVNRPRPSGDAATPYAGRLNFYGCGFRNDEADYYRLVYRYRADPADAPTDPQPFTGIDWYAVRENWPPVREHIRPVDDAGWYEIPDPDVLVDRYQNLLLHWNTRHDSPNDNGLYDVRLELADGSRNRLSDQTSDWLTLRVDNSRPTVRFDGLEWRTADGTEGGTLDLVCPVLRRPLDDDGNPKTVEIDVSYTVEHPHLRNVAVSAHGCGAGNPTRQGPDADFSFWYDQPSDTSYSRTDATFRVQGGTESAGRLRSGGYAIELTAWSRAFNPTRATAGIDHDWEIDPSHVGKNARLRIAIVNGD
jgi:hypothetical protein